MTKVARPDDLISATIAASIAERSERTIRRWAHPEVGKLGRWLGEPPVTGGAAPVLVSRRELMDHLVQSGQEPRSGGRPELHSSQEVTVDTASISEQDNRTMAADIRVAILEERLQAAELQTELAAVSAERNSLLAQVERLINQVEDLQNRADNAHAELRLDLASERDRSHALEAELKALRELQGVSWWQKLIGGPAPVQRALQAK